MKSELEAAIEFGGRLLNKDFCIYKNLSLLGRNIGTFRLINPYWFREYFIILRTIGPSDKKQRSIKNDTRSKRNQS